MKIDNLAGRELDMAVAKHVLGYECRMTAPSARLRATWSRARYAGKRVVGWQEFLDAAA